jgi:hypothetical protein
MEGGRGEGVEGATADYGWRAENENGPEIEREGKNKEEKVLSF